MQKEGGEEETGVYTLKLPHDLDGIVINLPAYLVGLPEEAYLSEFVSLIAEPTEDEKVIINEFAIPESDAPVATE